MSYLKPRLNIIWFLNIHLRHLSQPNPNSISFLIAFFPLNFVCFPPWLPPLLNYGWAKMLPFSNNLFIDNEYEIYNWGDHAFFRNNYASIWKKNAVHCFVFKSFLELMLHNYLWKISGSPNLLFGFRLPLQRSAPQSHERRKNTSTLINLILYKMIKIFIASHKNALKKFCYHRIIKPPEQWLVTWNCS